MQASTLAQLGFNKWLNDPLARLNPN